MTRPLTQEERAVLRAIAQYQAQFSWLSPSKRWLRTNLQRGEAVVDRALKGLEARGIIVRGPKPRQNEPGPIEIVDRSQVPDV